MYPVAKILIVMPMKPNDPTTFTYSWATKAAKIAKDMGYEVKTVEKQETTYANVTKVIREYKPDFFIAFSHGCSNSLLGQQECMVTRKYDPHEILQIIDSGNVEKIDMLRKMFNPMGGISCPGICKLSDTCSPLCSHPSNINELKGSIIFAVACFSAKQLGLCAEKYGVKSYTGYDDLFMFPVDSLNSQDIFGEVQLTFIKSLLMGRTIRESELEMNKIEDSYIRKYKPVKYISLPLLWNKLHRNITGNKDISIYQK